MGELHKGLVWRIDTRDSKKIVDELEQAKACHVIRLGEMPRTAYAGQSAMTLIVKTIHEKTGEQMISAQNRYLSGLHILSGGSILPFDILLTGDLV